MNLLHSYILDISPSAFVNTQSSWSKPENAIQTDAALIRRIRDVDPLFPRSTGLAFLLFDEAQDSYEDAVLWNTFFKGVSGGLYAHYRVILFCSYGSPSSRPVRHRIGAPLALRNAARIGLWPRDRSIGILFKRSEFDEVVSRFNRPLNLHPDLQDLIFEWTTGHAGAVVEILRLISYQVSSLSEQRVDASFPNPVPQRVSETRRGLLFTVETFHTENPTHELIQSLCGGAFERGLPTSEELQEDPEVVAVFRDLLVHGTIDSRENEDEAVQKCHRHGWIQSNRTTNERIIRYAFPSPLHAACISWRLEPTSNRPQFTSPYALALDAISKFKPSQLHLPIRHVNPLSTDKLPEAQYQDEFYRSVFVATSGNVRISPEFASARGAHVPGRIDFFIPVVKWGFEFTREGDRLQEHSSRFATSGAYGAWLKSGDMEDYILIDCRTSAPSKKYPSISLSLV